MIAHYLFPYLANINPPVSVRNVKENHPYRTMDGFFDFSNLPLENYSSYKLNEHHLTTNSIWTYVFPKFMDDFGLEWSLDEYDFVPFNKDNQDLSFHEYNKPMDIEVHADKIYFSLRDLDGTQLTAYHRLFVAPHQIATVYNYTAKTDRILRLNCDSMVIPLIPLITPYFQKIYVYDYRDNYKFAEPTDVTDELFAYISFNVNRIYGYEK